MILDHEPSKPFDENRKGLNLGEGGAYVVLISEKVKEALKLSHLVKVSGYANANDAHHQTASSAEGNGNYKAMSEALMMSNLKQGEIQYINAHGTGTANNDSSEGIAIQRLFGNKLPLISSTKAHTGHTLGACGSLEAVYSCLSLRHQLIYPNLRHQTKMKELNFTPNKELITEKPVQNIMSNSFGFGGNCTSLILSKE
jgi:3-oxoacyl-[acyl-carrier-protein] synthase-1